MHPLEAWQQQSITFCTLLLTVCLIASSWDCEAALGQQVASRFRATCLGHQDRAAANDNSNEWQQVHPRQSCSRGYLICTHMLLFSHCSESTTTTATTGSPSVQSVLCRALRSQKRSEDRPVRDHGQQADTKLLQDCTSCFAHLTPQLQTCHQLEWLHDGMGVTSPQCNTACQCLLPERSSLPASNLLSRARIRCNGRSEQVTPVQYCANVMARMVSCVP